MLFGDDKGRQMARSILPSQWRGAGRAKAKIRRAARRTARRSVAGLARDAEGWWDDGEDLVLPWARETRYVVQDRRNADKLNHFERWATAKTRDLPRADRLDAIRAIVPGGIIGSHALTHVARWHAFDTELPRRPWPRPPRQLLDRGELAELLRAIVALPDGHRALNRALEAQYQRLQQKQLAFTRRKLLGPGDVLPLLNDLAGAPYAALNAFCKDFKAMRQMRATVASP